MAKNWLAPFIKASKIASQEALAEAIGVSRATINRLANDHSQLKRDRAEELAPLLDASVDDLMLNRPPKPAPIVSSFDPDEVENDDDGTVSYSREHWVPAIDGAIPEIDTKLGAGMGTVGQTINLPVGGDSVSGHTVIAEWMIPLSYLRNEAKASPAHTLIMEVVGDSMQPTYMPGDRVLVDLSQDKMSTDTVYAISDGHTEPQIKRLQRIPFSDPAEVRIISDNQALETFTVELSRLQIIGRIVGHLARK
ncbi:repressor [Rhizobium sp. Leaf384]|uniref:S24 family peptidase n=1 Tax=Rhizobium sp. Leaf384 TaxID=1736358 RepID=UPI000714140F|nr:S24 family peptidase [Rhizobium sp. Leaf384]KQS79067.1 repressor [Rhizobium sp. Leaf384]